MLEVTIRRVTDKLATAKTQAFQFENDALQAFMTEAGPDVGYDVAELRVLGSPIVAEGQRVASVRTKTAGPGAPRTQAPGINTPIQEQTRQASEDQVREARQMSASAAAADAKARTQSTNVAKAAGPAPEKK